MFHWLHLFQGVRLYRIEYRVHTDSAVLKKATFLLTQEILQFDFNFLTKLLKHRYINGLIKMSFCVLINSSPENLKYER